MLKELGESSPALANPAVARCCKAWKRVYRSVLAEDGSEYRAARKAGEAYRAAMPTLDSRENCKDFVACVTHGILLGAILEQNGGKLLYAAQVALAAEKSSGNRKKLPDSWANLSESELKHLVKFLDKEQQKPDQKPRQSQ
jgi:hypothetical protein